MPSQQLAAQDPAGTLDLAVSLKLWVSDKLASQFSHGDLCSCGARVSSIYRLIYSVYFRPAVLGSGFWLGSRLCVSSGSPVCRRAGEQESIVGTCAALTAGREVLSQARAVWKRQLQERDKAAVDRPWQYVPPYSRTMRFTALLVMLAAVASVAVAARGNSDTTRAMARKRDVTISGCTCFGGYYHHTTMWNDVNIVSRQFIPHLTTVDHVLCHQRRSQPGLVLPGR